MRKGIPPIDHGAKPLKEESKEERDHESVGEDLKRMDERMDEMLMDSAFFSPFFHFVSAAAFVDVVVAFAVL